MRCMTGMREAAAEGTCRAAGVYGGNLCLSCGLWAFHSECPTSGLCVVAVADLKILLVPQKTCSGQKLATFTSRVAIF